MRLDCVVTKFIYTSVIIYYYESYYDKCNWSMIHGISKFHVKMGIFLSSFRRCRRSFNKLFYPSEKVKPWIRMPELHHQIHSLLNQLVSMIEERNFPEAMAIIHRLRRFEDVYKVRNHRTKCWNQEYVHHFHWKQRQKMRILKFKFPQPNPQPWIFSLRMNGCRNHWR